MYYGNSGILVAIYVYKENGQAKTGAWLFIELLKNLSYNIGYINKVSKERLV